MEQTYREQIQAIFGTDDLEQLRRIAQRLPLERNPRRAGRKGFFTPEQQVKLLEEYRAGKSMQALAAQYNTSRQTVFACLKKMQTFSDPNTTMRLHFMYKDTLCSTIDADFLHEKVSVTNYTDRIPLRAFGVVENPTWQDFQDFLEERCFPKSRAQCRQILRDIGLPFYDPLAIIEKTKGRMAEDDHWIQMISKGESHGER